MADLSVTARVKIIRLRTWTLTLTITALLILYIFVTIGVNSKLQWIDFAITASIQIITHFAYFADGERYGETDALYISARRNYNTNASYVMTESSVEKLRDYCEVDYENRKSDYIKDTCSKLGILVSELEEISKMPAREIRRLKKWESNGTTIYFDMAKRRTLKKLVFGKNPVEKNHTSTVLSAIDRDYVEAIKDGSKKYRSGRHIYRLLRSVVVGGVFAYIGFCMRDGLSFEAVVKSAAFMGSMICSAISSYIAGERASREYRKQFYLELSLFLASFFSWAGVKLPETDAE